LDTDRGLIPSNPFANRSKHTLGAETSPSVYPSTLGPNDDSDSESEETYWRKQGFEPVLDTVVSSSGPSSTASPATPQTPPIPIRDSSKQKESALGLTLKKSNSSISTVTVKGHMSESDESEVIKGMYPGMQPASIHQGSTAPIRMPSAWNLRSEGRYPLLTTQVGVS